jgi:hypothetical protein
MSKMPEDRPERQRNFHGTRGGHLFPHPAQYEPRKSAWDTWERRYAAHLDRHKELADNPERMEGDHPAVLALFDHIDHLQLIIEKEKQLIRALREKQAAGADPDEKDITAIRQIVRRTS